MFLLETQPNMYAYSEVSNKRTAGNKSTAAKIHSQNWTNFMK